MPLTPSGLGLLAFALRTPTAGSAACPYGLLTTPTAGSEASPLPPMRVRVSLLTPYKISKISLALPSSSHSEIRERSDWLRLRKAKPVGVIKFPLRCRRQAQIKFPLRCRRQAQPLTPLRGYKIYVAIKFPYPEGVEKFYGYVNFIRGREIL